MLKEYIPDATELLPRPLEPDLAQAGLPQEQWTRWLSLRSALLDRFKELHDEAVQEGDEPLDPEVVQQLLDLVQSLFSHLVAFGGPWPAVFYDDGGVGLLILHERRTGRRVTVSYSPAKEYTVELLGENGVLGSFKSGLSSMMKFLVPWVAGVY